MSLLMFNHDVESVVIVTDTLATTPGGEPLMFQSKAWALPHINMAMAVTGIANLGAAWNEFLRSSAIVQDIRMVNNFAPEQLRLIWHGMLAEASPEVSMHATVYHFGFEVGAELFSLLLADNVDREDKAVTLICFGDIGCGHVEYSLTFTVLPTGLVLPNPEGLRRDVSGPLPLLSVRFIDANHTVALGVRLSSPPCDR